jgi:hypothetical protein
VYNLGVYFIVTINVSIMCKLPYLFPPCRSVTAEIISHFDRPFTQTTSRVTLVELRLGTVYKCECRGMRLLRQFDIERVLII